MQDQIEKINQLNLEALTLINQLTSKSPRPVESTGVRINISTATGLQKFQIPTSLEDIASGKTDVDLD